jgi:nucleoside phosphorylase
MITEIDFLIHGAIWREVSETLARLRLRPADPNDLIGNYHISAQWKYYEGEVDAKRVGLITSGIGRRRTRQALKWLRRIRLPKRVISIGTGGALDPRMQLGQPWIGGWVASLSNFHTEGKYNLYIPTGLENLNTGGLITAAKPVLREKVREQVRQMTDARVVDMEAVAVARWGAKHDLPVTIIKVLTDYSDEGANREYSRQIANASRLLSRFCYDFIMDTDRFWPGSKA